MRFPVRMLFAIVLLTAAVTPRTAGLAAQPPAARIAGLRAPASVTTDRWAIPHVAAASLPDLYRAWGWTDARDRLWQMLWTRAAAEGLTHRWVGNTQLQADGGAQLFRLRERAAAIWQREQSDPDVRLAFESYAAGVNAYMAECREGGRAWPAEVIRLGAKPREWTPADCVLVLLGFGITLDLDLTELSEMRAVADSGSAWYQNRRRYEDRWMYDTVPDSAARRMWPARPAAAVSAAVPRGGAISPLAAREAGRWLAAFPPADAEGARRASNEFVVGGKRSASGMPLLANDPHLGLGTPSPFHVLHVRVPGLVDAIGAGVAGLPVIVSGRNERVAWGVTAVSADVVDVYADTLTADAREVIVHGGDGRVTRAPVRSEAFDLQFRVLGVGIPVPVFMNARRSTPHGPVLLWDPKHRLAYSARWTAMEDDSITLAGIVGLERAASAADLDRRASTLVTPCLNMVSADVSGDVRYRATGLLPVRAQLPGPGPVPSDGKHEWTGFVPREENPHWRVPPALFAVNANNRPVAGTYPYALPRYDWAHDRARRIAQRLEGDASLTLEDLASVQNDVTSLAADRHVRHLLECADTLWSILPPRARAAVETLRTWDLRARRSSVAPTIYRAWWGALMRRSHTEGFPGLTLAAIMSRAPEALPAPGKPGLFETPSIAAGAALGMALDTLSAKLGPDLATWTYGRAHLARFRHPLSVLDGRGRWEPPLTPEDGDNASPCVGASRLPWSFEVGHGPAFRHVVDLARPGVSYGIVPPWNSAAFPDRGAHRRRWADHGYVPFVRDSARIAAAAIERVTLQP